MPVYEYRCGECGEKTERLEAIGQDSSGERCPACGRGVLRKVFSLFGTGRSEGRETCAPGGSGRFT